MEIVDQGPATAQPVGREMTPVQIAFSRLRYWLLRQRRRLPYLVWYNDEMDVTVTFSKDKLTETDDPDGALRQLFSGSLYEVEAVLHEMGIGFDSGMGFGGRDWEWDWSLRGPISIRFRGRAQRPELRKERPRPMLAFSATKN